MTGSRLGMWSDVRERLCRTMGWPMEMPVVARQVVEHGLREDGDAVRTPTMLFAVAQDPMDEGVRLTVSTLAVFEAVVLDVDRGLRLAMDGDPEGLEVVEDAVRLAESWLWPEPEEEE